MVIYIYVKILVTRVTVKKGHVAPDFFIFCFQGDLLSQKALKWYWVIVLRFSEPLSKFFCGH